MRRKGLSLVMSWILNTCNFSPLTSGGGGRMDGYHCTQQSQSNERTHFWTAVFVRATTRWKQLTNCLMSWVNFPSFIHKKSERVDNQVLLQGFCPFSNFDMHRVNFSYLLTDLLLSLQNSYSFCMTLWNVDFTKMICRNYTFYPHTSAIAVITKEK